MPNSPVTHRRPRRWAVTTPVAVAAALLAALAPPATALDGVPVDGQAGNRTSPGASRVAVSAAVGDLEVLEVRATRTRPDVPAVALGQTRVCVVAEREDIRTDDEDEIKTVFREHGCLTGFREYQFNAVTWEATVEGQVPTTLRTSVYERSADGWSLVTTSESPARATVDLAWHGEGSEEVTYWAKVPQWCGFFPPLPCSYGANATVTRGATVHGSVVLGGVGTTAVLPSGQTGTMGWSATAYCSITPSCAVN